MKKIINDPKNVVDEMLNGVVAAHPNHVKRLEGFEVLVREEGPSDKVALISGVGSGHEPSHGGFLGKGMLDDLHHQRLIKSTKQLKQLTVEKVSYWLSRITLVT